MLLLDLLFLGPTQRHVAACLLVLLILAWGVGRGLRAGGALAPALGFLVLAGAASLALLALRRAGVPLAWFGPATAALALAMIVALRRALPPSPPSPAAGRGRWLAATVTVLALVLWTLRIIQLDPSASLSSHHGWYPLYIEGSFELGRFAEVGDFAFGNGYLASIFYNLDLMGVTALGRWFGPFSAWHAYSAASTLAALLAVAVLAESLGRSRLALIIYAGMVLALLATDFLYRTTMARNWGDAMLFLGGAVMLATLTRGGDIRTAALWTAAAAVFLVVARHYGAFYAGMVMLVGYLACWRLQRRADIGPWLILGVVLLVLTAREIACVVWPPSPYYPGSKLLDVAAPPPGLLLIGSLNDLGLLTNGHMAALGVSWRNLYLVALAVLFGFWLWRRRELGGRWLGAALMPLGLALLPQVLQYLTLYRSSPDYSKTTLVALHLFAWYPAFVAGRLGPAIGWRPPARAVAVAALAAVAAAIGGGALMAQRAGLDPRQGPAAMLDWAFALYRDHNADLNVARLMRERWGADKTAAVSERPILYLHYEPGLGLRNFIGGRLFCDLDFWGPTVQGAARDATSLADLVARLGYPNLYLSLGDSSLYHRYAPEHWNRFAADFAAIGEAGWIEDRIDYRSATLLVPRRPADAPPPPCPSVPAPHRP